MLQVPKKSIVRIILFLVIILYFCNAKKVIPLRSKIISYDKRYYKDPITFVKRYGRKSDYYLFIEGTLLVAFGNNVTLHLVFNEFLHNEYRRSFIEIKFKLCDFHKFDEYLGPDFKKQIPECPFPASHQKYENISFPLQSFPNMFPFRKGRVDVFINATDTRENIAYGFLEALFEQ